MQSHWLKSAKSEWITRLGRVSLAHLKVKVEDVPWCSQVLCEQCRNWGGGTLLYSLLFGFLGFSDSPGLQTAAFSH